MSINHFYHFVQLHGSLHKQRCFLPFTYQLTRLGDLRQKHPTEFGFQSYHSACYLMLFNSKRKYFPNERSNYQTII